MSANGQNFGDAVGMRTVLMHGRDTRLRAVVPVTNAATFTPAAAIGANGTMEVRNDTGEYIEILGYRIYDTSGGGAANPFAAYIELGNGQRQFAQSFSQGMGVHSAFMGANGPWGTPTFWKDSDGPGRSNRSWGMRGLSPREVLRVNILNMSANQPVIVCEFICRTKAAVIPGNVPWDYWQVIDLWNKWRNDFQTMAQAGENGDDPLYKTGGLYRIYPLFDPNMPGAQNNRALANFGSVALAAAGETQVELPFGATREGLVVLHSFFATSTGDFEFEFQGGGYESVRDGVKRVSAAANLQGNAGRTNNNFYAEGIFTVPRPYNVEQPPTILLRDLSGAPNNITMQFAGVEISRETWMAGAGAR